MYHDVRLRDTPTILTTLLVKEEKVKFLHIIFDMTTRSSQS